MNLRFQFRARLCTALMIASLGAADVACAHDDEPSSAPGKVDKVHDFIGASMRGLASRMDRFFTDERSLAEEQNSRLLVTPTVDFVEGKETEVSVPINARFMLPRLEEKLQFQFTTAKDDDTDVAAKGQNPIDDLIGDENERRAFLGLVYTTVAEQARNISVRGGLRLRDGEVKLAASVRARFTAPIGLWETRLTQTFFHDGDEFGSRSLLDFDRPINHATLFRSTSEALVTETSEGFELLQRFLLRHLLDEHSGVELFFTTEGHTDPVTVADRYTLGVAYRKRVWKDWLTLSLQPELRFPRELEFDREAALIVALEMYF